MIENQTVEFDNTYIKLPERFYEKVLPAKVSEPKLMKWNDELANDLGISRQPYSDEDLGQIFSGQRILESSEPIATAYAGHQYAHFVPQLGDGRAILLGEVVNPQGQRFDVQLKGSGLTKFSRRGDGKSAIGPVIREYIISEAMFHLGVPTTRSLAAVSTGEVVYREQEMPGISHVINYDLPDEAENYVHRIGRTGRGFAKGAAVSFLSPEENEKLAAVEEFIQTKINVLEVTLEEPDITEEEVEEMDISAMLAHEEALAAPRKNKKKRGK